MKQKNHWLFWSIVIAVIILLVWGVLELAKPQDNTKNQSAILNIKDNDWIKGDKNAPLILVEYSDFQCPACETASFYGQQLDADSSTLASKVAIVYRHYPLPMHTNARLAAQAAEAAGKQNKFWEMHNLLFDKQNDWAASTSARDIFIGYAETLALNIEQFKTDLDANDSKDKINQDIKDGNALNISYTPTLFLNGKIINLPNSYDKFRQLLTTELNSSQANQE